MPRRGREGGWLESPTASARCACFGGQKDTGQEFRVGRPVRCGRPKSAFLVRTGRWETPGGGESMSSKAMQMVGNESGLVLPPVGLEMRAT